MKRLLRLHPAIWLSGALALLCASTVALAPGRWVPRQHEALVANTIYPYRQWQSTGIRLQAGDFYRIRARGEWSYSPIVGLHGPEGGRPAPPQYPLPSAPGGALLGRVGEAGAPFYVGRGTGGYAREAGTLFLRINDDLLGDNAGQVQVSIDVTPAATPAP